MICAERMCTGCMACVVSCPVGAISIKDEIEYFNAIIDSNKCIKCNKCRNVCQQNYPCSFVKPLFWKQGWASDNKIRYQGSSGGVATALMHFFVDKGGVVVSCKLINGEFSYSLITETTQINRYSGSKYVKSNPVNAYKIIKDYLIRGYKVLFIGLPCHVAGIKKFIGKNKNENLYLVDLICHGSPSQRILDMFLEENGIDKKKISYLRFREKEKFGISSDEIFVGPKSVLDRYTMGFLTGLFYTENCYQCKFAQCDRISDITLGDSWGSELKNELNEGISLIICSTVNGKELIENCKLELFDVNRENAIVNNGQLDHPMTKPSERDKFFVAIRKGKTFSEAVFRAYPYVCTKQEIKRVLIKFGLRKDRQ